MPFRHPYGGVYDPPTLSLLQDVFEFVWLGLVDLGISVTREHLAERIFHAYQAGLPPERIKEMVVAELRGSGS